MRTIIVAFALLLFSSVALMASTGDMVPIANTAKAAQRVGGEYYGYVWSSPTVCKVFCGDDQSKTCCIIVGNVIYVPYLRETGTPTNEFVDDTATPIN